MLRLSVWKSLVWFPLCALVACTNSAADETPLEEDEVEDALKASSGAVLANGKHKEVGQLNWHVGDAWGLCTGTLVGKRTVITSAHCVSAADGPNAVFRLDRAGDGFAGAPEPGDTDINHPGSPVASYHRFSVTGRGGADDIAVIQLLAPLVIPGVTPATLATSYPTSGSKDIYGYGPCLAGSNQKSALRSNALPLLGQPNVACGGDSGGPHFVTGSSRIMLLTSGSTGPANARLAVVAELVPRRTELNELIARSESGKELDNN